MFTRRALFTIALTILAGSYVRLFAQDSPHLGKAISEADVAAWDISILPDGTGLPPGSGTPEQGSTIFAAKCAVCHGENGKGGSAAADVGCAHATHCMSENSLIHNRTSFQSGIRVGSAPSRTWSRSSSSTKPASIASSVAAS